MTASPTPRADDMVRNQAVASLMRQELTDETPAACPIACPYCHANAGFDRERMNGIRTDETTHATCHACGGRYRIQPVHRYLVDKEPER